MGHQIVCCVRDKNRFNPLKSLKENISVIELDFPDMSQVTANVAAKHSLQDLLQRIDAVEELRANLETNAQEQLALEVAFLNAFG